MKNIANALLAAAQRYVHAAQDLAEAGRYHDAALERHKASRVGRCAGKAAEFLLFREGDEVDLTMESEEFRTLELTSTYEDLWEEIR